MHEDNQSITVPGLVALLRRHAVLIGLILILAVGTSIFLSSSAEPQYEAKARLGFNDNSADLQALGIPAAGEFQPDKEAAAQAERVTRPDVVDAVRRRLGLRESADEVQASITTRVDPASNLVEITASARTGELAARLANAFALEIKDDATKGAKSRFQDAAASSRRRARGLRGDKNAGQRAVVEEQAARLAQLANLASPVDIVRGAQVPADPSSPKPVRNAVLAALLGLILGVGLAFLRQSLDRRLLDQADVERYLDAPVIGQLRTKTLGRTPLTAVGETPLTADEDLEPFRILRTNMSFLSPERPLRTVLVTSPLPEEGKSTVACGLAWAEALTGRRTLLVDCDLRRPTVAARLGVSNTPGLTEFLLGEADPGDILRRLETGTAPSVEGASLVCIPAGRPVPNHAELLESERFRTFLEQVAEVYDRVIIDSAPLLPVSDTLALVPQVDTVLLCTRLRQSKRDETQAAQTALARFPSRPIGVVLTAADKSQSPYYVGSYDYSQAPAREPV